MSRKSTEWNSWRYSILNKLKDDFGGCCIECGEEDFDLLQFHHRDSATKLFTIGKGAPKPYSILEEEAFKCDLLCKKCHMLLHASLFKIPHGTLGGYKNHRCRCDDCTDASTTHMRQYRASKKLK